MFLGCWFSTALLFMVPVFELQLFVCCPVLTCLMVGSAAEEGNYGSGLREQEAADPVLSQPNWSLAKAKGKGTKCSSRPLFCFPGSMLVARASEKRAKELLSLSLAPRSPVLVS